MITSESQKLRDEIRSGKLSSEQYKHNVEMIYIMERSAEEKLIADQKVQQNVT